VVECSQWNIKMGKGYRQGLWDTALAYGLLKQVFNRDVLK
jgi:hypothetical protein